MPEMNEKVLTAFTELVQTTLAGMQKKLEQMETSMTYLQNENRDLVRSQSTMEKKLRVTQGVVTQLQTKVLQQQEEIIDLKSRSMRENMVFTGLDEDANESWETSKTKVLNFVKNVLKVPQTELNEIQIDRAHRLGAKSTNARSRPIVAKFCNTHSKNILFKYLKNLKGVPGYSVNEQYPPEIQERRKRLWPMFKEAKEKGNEVKWNVDKLVINHRTYTAKDDNVEILMDEDKLPDIPITHSQALVHEGSSFIGHAAKVSSAEEVAAVLTQLTSDRMFASANHTFYAYRIGRQANIKEKCKDDNEHGAGTTLLKQLQENENRNIVVIVSRWITGQHIGPKRFELIKKCAKQAIDLLNNEVTD